MPGVTHLIGIRKENMSYHDEEDEWTAWDTAVIVSLTVMFVLLLASTIVGWAFGV